MKKRNVLISISVLAVILFTTVAFAQGAGSASDFVQGILKAVKSLFEGILNIFFDDLSTQKGQVQVVKVILFFVLTAAIYEGLQLISIRPLIAFLVGAGLSVATVLLIPSTALLAVFTAASSLVIVLLLVALFAVPSVLTWRAAQEGNKLLNSALIFLWLVILILFTFSIRRLTIATSGNTWLGFLVTMYCLAVIIYLFMHMSKPTEAISGAVSKAWNWVTSARQVAVVQSELDQHIRKLETQGATWADAAAFASNFGNDVLIELRKLAAILRFERSKTRDPAIQAEIDEITEVIDTAGGRFGGTTVGNNGRGHFISWITFLNTEWGNAGTVSVTGVSNLGDPAGKAQELTANNHESLVPCLKALERYITNVNRQLARKP